MHEELVENVLLGRDDETAEGVERVGGEAQG